MSELPLHQILVGDALTRLKELPDASVDCVITSPPYFRMRDYAHPDQRGAETHVDAWADGVAEVCAELHRVLTPTGSLWLNLGDGYSRAPSEGVAKKSLLLGPQRVVMRLTRAGWIVRNQLVWAKRNPMPQSVRDRLTNSHEFVYFLTKQPRGYFFDLDAIRQPVSANTVTTVRRRVAHYPPRLAVPALGGGTTPRIDLNQGLATMKQTGQQSHPGGKNPGDVWFLASASYRGAHFATFPPELVRRPLLATCPQQVCTTCGQPWQRKTQMLAGRRRHSGPLAPACGCRSPARPGIVLDPFCGAGTVCLVAEAHGRNWIGIELNPAYAAQAEARIAAARPTSQPTKRKDS